MNLSLLSVKIQSALSSRLAKDSFLQFIMNSISAIFSFFQLPLLLKLLGGQGFGELVLFQTGVYIFSALTLVQFYQGMMKFAPKAKDEDVIIHKCLRIGIINEFFSTALLSILFFVLQHQIADKLNNLSKYNFLLLISVGIATSLGNGQTISAYLRLAGKYQKAIFWGAISTILRFSLLVILPICNISIEGVIIISFLLPEVVKLLALLMHVPFKMLVKTLPYIKNLKEIYRFSFYITLQEWCDLPVKQFDKIILSFFVQPVDVGIYQILRRIGNLLAMVVAPFAASFFHEFSERINAGNRQSALRLFYQSVLIFSLVSIGLAIMLMFSNQYWAPYLFVGIHVDSLLIMLIIVIYIVVNGFNSIHSLLYAIDGVKESLIITVSTNILFFGLAIILGSTFFVLGIVIAFGIQVLTVIIAKLYVIKIKYRNCTRF